MTPPRTATAGEKATEKPVPPAPKAEVLLVGNPNVGKSVLFQLLTGTYATVSNYPGTTAELMHGHLAAKEGSVIDLPGANTLVPDCDVERVTRDVLLDHFRHKDLQVIQVADAKNLRRSLALTFQLAELEVPTVLVLNLMDEADRRGIEIDEKRLSTSLGIEVIKTVATQRKGTQPLQEGTLPFGPVKADVRYAESVEKGVAKIIDLLPPNLLGKRGIALLLLTDDGSLDERATAWMGEIAGQIKPIREAVEKELNESTHLSIQRSRVQASEKIVRETVVQKNGKNGAFSRKLGTLLLHPFWGLVGVVAVLYAMYLFVGVLGAGMAVDFLETTVFGEVLTPAFDKVIRFLTPGVLETFLVGPPGTELGTGPGLLIGEYGVISMALSYAVAIILPIVGFFFISFSLLEDSGYLPRLAVLLNRWFRWIGLNGKAVLPMVLGLGCDTMATMTSRILSARKERLITTLLLALAVPCSAQLGVILGMLGGLGLMATSVWLGTIVGVMIFVGYLAAKVIPGDGSDFIMEIPPLRRPVIKNVILKTVARIEWYLREAVPLFILGTFVLWVFDRLKLLGMIEKAASPLIEGWLGLPGKATEAFLIGFLRRDYGAAGLYNLFQDSLGKETVSAEIQIQIIVSMVTITLFIPCIANVFVIIKDFGWKTAARIAVFVFPFALLVGGLLNFALRGIWL